MKCFLPAFGRTAFWQQPAGHALTGDTNPTGGWEAGERVGGGEKHSVDPYYHKTTSESK